MRVTLQRTCGIKSFDAVVTIESMTNNRSDLVELLQFIQDNGGLAREEDLVSIMGEAPIMIVRGIIGHLKANGFLQQNGALAAKGKQVIESGQVPLEERGLFTMYFLEDAIFQDRLLHYERSGKGKTAAASATPIDEARFASHSHQSVLDRKVFKLKHFDGNRPLANMTEDSGSCEIRWEIDTTREDVSQFFMKGDLKGVVSRSFRSDSFAFDLLKGSNIKRFLHMIIDMAKKSDAAWNPSTECLEVPLYKLQEQDYEQLQTSLKIPALDLPNLGKFETAEMHAVPIAPKNAADAKKWIMILVAKYLKDGYKSHKELSAYLDEIKERNSFRNFRYVIESMTVDDMLRDLRETDRYTAYWNLQTPIDLYAEIDDRYIVRQKQIDLAAGKQLSMMELVDQLVGSEQPDVLVFSSKYVKNSAQIKKFELFVDSFKEKGVRSVVLVTKDPVRLRDQMIQVETYDDVYTGSIHPHDRYFAFKVGGSWHRFKMTAELDQCRYENVFMADAYTVGAWLDITFMEIMPEVFPEKLNERISQVEEVNYL